MIIIIMIMMITIRRRMRRMTMVIVFMRCNNSLLSSILIMGLNRVDHFIRTGSSVLRLLMYSLLIKGKDQILYNFANCLERNSTIQKYCLPSFIPL